MCTAFPEFLHINFFFPMTLIFEKTAWLGIKSLAYTLKKSALLRYNLHENSPILRLQLENLTNQYSV